MRRKIAYCIESFHNSGGMERILSVCANLLVEHHLITLIIANQCNKPYAYKLSENIQVVDLHIGLKDYKLQYQKVLSEYLLNHSFDIVFSLAGLEMFFLHQIKDKSKKVMWFHFAFDVSHMFLSERYHGGKLKLLYYLHTFRRIYYAKKFDKLVVLSKADYNSWSKFCNNVTYIYNPITIKGMSTSNTSSRSAIAVGRLSWQKGFDYLIDSWAIVATKHPDWHLDIYGDGPDRDMLQEKIDNYGLKDNISLCGVTKHIEQEYCNHSFYIMSSRAEGFPLVLLEASSCGLPLISFNCPQGPKEIIVDGENGFLINIVGDIDSLSHRICTLIEDKELRESMGKKATDYSQRFSRESIKNKWLQLINDLLK